MKKETQLFEAIAIMVGTIIGAGIFGIPYVIYQAGFLTGILLMFIIAAAICLIHLYIGEIALSTEKIHQLTGYAEKYLGVKGKYAMFVSVFFGFYGALLAYVIGEGQALAALFGGNSFWYSLGFFVVAAFLVYKGMNIVKKADFFLSFLVLLIVFVIALVGAPHLNWRNLQEFNLLKILIPYGVIFFAMGGVSAVPQLREVLRGREKQIKKAIIIGTGMPLLVYLLFTFMVIGISGSMITEVATVGLGRIVGESMILFGNLFAVLAMTTSFLTLGLALKSTYLFDFKLKPGLAWGLTVALPLIMFILGLHSFVRVIGLAGALGGSIEGLLILLIVYKLKNKRERQPEYQISKNPILMGLLALLFVGGIVYTLWHL